MIGGIVASRLDLAIPRGSLQAWVYERTRSVYLSMVIHAAFNTLPLTLVLLREGPRAPWEDSSCSVPEPTRRARGE